MENIIHWIDSYLEKEKKLEATPTELSPYLDRNGILKDSESRKGKPLRDLLRKNKIPHAYQKGNRWFIPKSRSIGSNKNIEKFPKSVVIPEVIKEYKLYKIAELIKTELEKKYESKANYIFEYKPVWLKTYPNKEELPEYWERIISVYNQLTNNKFDLENKISSLDNRRLIAKQSFDIWFSEPFNLAIEFDEKQHFNSFRKKTLSYYNGLKLGFNIDEYRILNNRIINPGKSGFTKLKSNDPLFPEMYEGGNQDNRIRQRAFRDYLKDILPLSKGFKPTLRIPSNVTNGNIKDFSKNDLENIKCYIKDYI